MNDILLFTIGVVKNIALLKQISTVSDVSATQIMLRKLITLADLTICLDKRNASGKIEMYQVRNTPLYVDSFKLNFFVVRDLIFVIKLYSMS